MSLIAESVSNAGELAALIRSGKEGEATRCLERWREVFKGTLCIEVQLHHTGGHEAALAAELIRIGNDAGVPWLATQDPRYADDEQMGPDDEARERFREFARKQLG